MLKLPVEHVAPFREFYRARDVCVTGGAGFIGSHLVEELLSLGASISVLDDLSNSTTEHVAPLIDAEPGRVRFVHGSILDDAALTEAMLGCASVFHLAAIGSVPRSFLEPSRYMAVNAHGTLRVMEAARREGVGRVVYSSSSSVYGEALPGQGASAAAKTETQVPRPMSPYAASKLAGEHVVQAWASGYGIQGVSLRLFNVFGPRQHSDSSYAAVIPQWSRCLLTGRPPVLYGDGQQTRDFTYVSNVVLGLLLAGASQRVGTGESVNIGTGRSVSLKDLLALVASAFPGPAVVPQREPARTGEVRHSRADIALAERLLGYQPLVDLEEGVRQTADWFQRAHRDAGGFAPRVGA
ncbi:MAG: NAD-dependent epimerase/dehydratase family protein [Phycisphaerae bacterium]|nr:NAD-dependent epimerase/dehydratase family protein [Phycisphaerae bacterium]